jgi:juvenile hormone epoxide hydrolase
LFRVPVLPPTACINTPEDLAATSEIGLRAKFPNLKQFTPANVGGHFAAYEVPQIVAKEALRFFKNVEFNGY